MKQANINAGYVFWEDLTDEKQTELLKQGYDKNDLAGRVSKNDRLTKKGEIE